MGHALAAAALPPTAARGLMVGLWASVAVVVVRRGAPDAFRAAACLVAALLLVLPTVHPWYLVVLLPLLALEPWWGWIALVPHFLIPMLFLIPAVPCV